MPEIPEMELYKKNLKQWVRGKIIRTVRVYRPKSINRDVEEFANYLQNRAVQDIERRGKFLVFHLDHELKLLTHMMLDGRLYYLPSERASQELEVLDLIDSEEIKHSVAGLPGKPSVMFRFVDGSVLFFCQLTLGYLHLLNAQELEAHLSELGPDPLDLGFTVHKFQERLSFAARRSKIKPWLMNQKNLAGIGNAYSNESLFLAKLLPVRTVGSLEEYEKKGLYDALTQVINDSIQRGGDMEEPFMPGDSLTGGFNPYFQVYERAGELCKFCGETIKKEEVGGRNAFYCPVCQH